MKTVFLLFDSLNKRMLNSYGGKYIETPKGVMPLKSLLVSSVSKIRDISDIQLMRLIKDIVDSEKKPKSDKKITIELNKKGFGLARRTISKYRKMNNIPSSRER